MLIHDTPALDWLLLTKRTQNFFDRLMKAGRLLNGADQVESLPPINTEVADWIEGWMQNQPPVNVWIGTSVEDQQAANTRIPELLKIPAKIRFLSCEPLLGPVAFSCPQYNGTRGGTGITSIHWNELIHWVIAGGESGPNARPMHPDWVRSLRDQCATANVPFLFKQWGEWIPRSQALRSVTAAIELCKGSTKDAVMRRDTGLIDEGLGRANSSNDADSSIYKVGKKVAGRLLDGNKYNGFPA